MLELILTLISTDRQNTELNKESDDEPMMKPQPPDLTGEGVVPSRDETQEISEGIMMKRSSVASSVETVRSRRHSMSSVGTRAGTSLGSGRIVGGRPKTTEAGMGKHLVRHHDKRRKNEESFRRRESMHGDRRKSMARFASMHNLGSWHGNAFDDVGVSWHSKASAISFGSQRRLSGLRSSNNGRDDVAISWHSKGSQRSLLSSSSAGRKDDEVDFRSPHQRQEHLSASQVVREMESSQNPIEPSGLERTLELLIEDGMCEAYPRSKIHHEAPGAADVGVSVRGASAEQSAHEERDGKCEVSFSNLTIRYYRSMLGDNPSCTSGPSLSLDWTYDPSSTHDSIPVDDYERYRSRTRRPNEWELVLTRVERERRLYDLGYTRSDIALATAQNLKVKGQRRQTVVNLPVAGMEEFLESVRKSVGKMFLTRRSSNHIYDDWRRGKWEPKVVEVVEVESKPSLTTEAASTETKTSVESVTQDQNLQQRRGKRERSDRWSERWDKTDEVEGEKSDNEQKGSAELPQHKDVAEEELETCVHRRRARFAAQWSSENLSSTDEAPAFGIIHTQTSMRVVLNMEEQEALRHLSVRSSIHDLIPYAVVDLVSDGSPAERAGLRSGDEILRFGTVTSMDHRSLKAIPEVIRVAAIEEAEVPVVVRRDDDDDEFRCTLRPMKWGGPGLVGFLLRPYQGKKMQ